MITTKKIAIEYIQKEMRKDFNITLKKKSTKHKRREECWNWETKNKNKNKNLHRVYKQQNGRSKSLSVNTLNINGLKCPFKGQRLSESIKTHNPTPSCLQDRSLGPKT